MPKTSSSVSASLLVAGGEQGADEIVLRVGAPCREQVGEVLDELAHLAEEALQRLRPDRRRDDRVRPLLEAVLVGVRDAEQLRDHRDRERERVLGREVHRAARLDRVDQLVRDLLDPRAQLLDHPGRERLRHESA